MNPVDLAAVRAACRAFPDRFHTLHLGSASAGGQPEASYAPYVADQGSYYVFLSDLAQHSANLRANPRASVLFIEPEHQAQHLFARERLTLNCEARECHRDTPRFEEVMVQFSARFGKFINTIRPLRDFRLFELLPVSGSYVAGFARAYALEGEDLGHVRLRDAAAIAQTGNQLKPEPPAQAAACG